MEANQELENFDVCIVGGGWSGILACKYAIENGLRPVVLESREKIGGIWAYSDDPEIPTVMKSTITSSSATVTEAADFYMKEEYGSFLTHEEVFEYLQDYIKNFDINSYFRFNHKVSHTEKREGQWIVECENSKRFSCKNLVLAVGAHQRPRKKVSIFEGYTGNLRHSIEVKSVEPSEYKETDNILVYGGGETASDIIEILVQSKAKITWSVPSGQHFLRKTSIQKSKGIGSFKKDGLALDEANSNLIQMISPLRKSKPGVRWLCTYSTTGNLFDYEGHGIPEWKKGAPYMHAFLNKNAHAVDFVRSGRVTPKGPVSESSGNDVSFKSGETENFTHIIACTGYDFERPFLPKERQVHCPGKLYKLIFDHEDPSISYIGLARPLIGSIPLTAEMQCQYAFKVISGKLSLPSSEQMKRIGEEDAQERKEYFYNKRIPATLVEPLSYVNDLATLAGTKPVLSKLLFSNPVVFFKVLTSPLTAAHFVLNDPKNRDKALKHIWNRQRYQWALFPFVFLVLRIFQFDKIIDFFAERKYQKQIGK